MPIKRQDGCEQPVDEWESYACRDDDDPEALGFLGEDDPDDWASEADEPNPK